jgi:transposase
MGQDGGDQRLGVRADGARLALEPLGAPFGVAPMGTGHVIGQCTVAPAAVAAGMDGDQLAAVKHLDRASGGACVDLLADQPMRDGMSWTRNLGRVLKLGSPWLEDGPDDGETERYSADFKARVALEALRGELTTAQLAAKHGLHQTMISEWKRQAVAGLAEVFAGKTEAKAGIREEEREKLHAKIGQLVVERDFLSKASGR